jgi:hypothetical protein
MMTTTMMMMMTIVVVVVVVAVTVEGEGLVSFFLCLFSHAHVSLFLSRFAAIEHRFHSRLMFFYMEIERLSTTRICFSRCAQ